MFPLVQTTFEEPTDRAALDEALVVHQRTTVTTNQALIVFVHGLGGRRYGKKATWGLFPKFVFEDFPTLDVGLYMYRTLLGRLRFRKSVDLKTEANVFADIIRDATAYDAVLLVGHSMGGLLCKAAIRHWIVNNEDSQVPRIAGLILMATPQTGSLRVPKFLSWLTSDSRALKPNGAFVTEIQELFDNFILSDVNATAPNKWTIPTFAVLGSGDWWVDKLSAGLGLPNRQKKMARGSHTEIVKPKSEKDETYAFVRMSIQRCLELRGLAVMPAAGVPRVAGPSEVSVVVYQVRAALEEARRAAYDFLREKHPEVADDHVRANIFLPEYGSGGVDDYTLRIHPGLYLKMDRQAELGITFQAGQGATGKVFELGQARVALRNPSGPGQWDAEYEITKELAAIIHPELQWIISMPLKDGTGKPIGVMNIDGLSEKFDFDLLKDCATSVLGMYAMVIGLGLAGAWSAIRKETQ